MRGRNIIRITESDFNRLVKDTTERNLVESRMSDEIRTAQKQLYSIGNTLSCIGNLLEVTRFQSQFRKVWDEVNKLNDRLIGEIRKTTNKINK